MRDKSGRGETVERDVEFETEQMRGTVSDIIGVMGGAEENAKNFNVEDVRTAKIVGGNINDVQTIHGMVIRRNVEGSSSKRQGGVFGRRGRQPGGESTV